MFATSRRVGSAWLPQSTFSLGDAYIAMLALRKHVISVNTGALSHCKLIHSEAALVFDCAYSDHGIRGMCIVYTGYSWNHFIHF